MNEPTINGVTETVGSGRWDWLEYDSGGPDADGFYWLTVTPKRRYWLYPRFWREVLRSRSLMPTAADVEITTEIEVDE